MEMNDKYYNLILEIITNNKKFEGYEALLDDIALDVYNNSIKVVDVITDEDVIKAYLTKMVAQAFITVPKKMQLKKNTEYKSIHIVTNNTELNTEIHHKQDESDNIVIKSYPNDLSELQDIAENNINENVNIDNDTKKPEVSESEISISYEVENDITDASDKLETKPEPDFQELEIIDTQSTDDLEPINTDTDVGDIELITENSALSDLYPDNIDSISLSINDDKEDTIQANTVEPLSDEEDNSAELQVNDSTEEVSIEEKNSELLDINETEELSYEEFSDITLQETNLEQENVQKAAPELVDKMINSINSEAICSLNSVSGDNNNAIELKTECEDEIVPATNTDLNIEADEKQEELSIVYSENLNTELVENSDIDYDLDAEQEDIEDIITLDIPVSENNENHNEVEESVTSDDEILEPEPLLSDEYELQYSNENVEDILSLEEENPEQDNIDIIENVSDNIIDTEIDFAEDIDVSNLEQQTDLYNLSEPSQEIQLLDANELSDVNLLESGTEQDSNNNELMLETQDDELFLDVSEDLTPYTGNSVNEQLGNIQNEEYNLSDKAPEIQSFNENSDDESDETLEALANMAFKELDYSAFSYIPDVINNNQLADAFVNKLLELNQKAPELNILSIFDLKYKKNYSIDKIISELNLSKDVVLDALNKIVELI